MRDTRQRQRELFQAASSGTGIKGQPTYLLSTETVGDVALELPRISLDADELNVNAKEFDLVTPRTPRSGWIIEGELAYRYPRATFRYVEFT